MSRSPDSTNESRQEAQQSASPDGRMGQSRAVIESLRPCHWVKNLLVPAPLFLAHEVTDSEKLLAAAIAFLSFSACASAGYVINDLLDVRSDRGHPEKRNRPLASGALSPVAALAIVTACLGAGLLSAAWFLPIDYLSCLVLYVLLTAVYSAWIKRVVLVDVFVLAGFYSLRIVAGGRAADVPISEWLIAFSMFLFLSLAFLKRYSELLRLEREQEDWVCGRGYQVGDISLIESFGIATGALAVLVFALYVASDTVQDLYARPFALWLICPMLLYWVARLWIKAKRGALPEDPVLFSVKDPVSFGIGAATIVLLLFAGPQ